MKKGELINKCAENRKNSKKGCKDCPIGIECDMFVSRYEMFPFVLNDLIEKRENSFIKRWLDGEIK